MKIQKNKKFYMLINIIICLALVLPIMKDISPFQFSDGIPMLSRINALKNGEFSILKYLFLAHGNSMHVLIYFLAFLDEILFHQSIFLLKIGTFVGMFGVGIVVARLFWREEQDFILNTVLSITCNIIIIGSYNFDLYLPFQVVLTLSRLIFILLLYGISVQLIDFDKKRWGILLFFSILASWCHGMGMMFAGSIFYMHIVTRQKKVRIMISFLPFFIYNVLQVYFNSGYGEVTTSKSYFIKYIKELILALFSYYGATLYQLFGISRGISIIFGAIIFSGIFLVLIYFFFRGIWGDKIPELLKLNSSDKVFTLGLIGISFLAAFGSATFTIARIDLVESIAIDPIGIVIGTGRYLVFGVVPYVIFLFFIMKKMENISNNMKNFAIVFAIILVIFTFYRNIFLSKMTISRNRDLDDNAVALLTGLDYQSLELQQAYGDFAQDWYWGVKIPYLYEQLKNEENYIWLGLPNIDTDYLDINSLDLLGCSRIDYQKSSDINYMQVQLKTSRKPKNRYSAVVNEDGIVVGYVYLDKSKGFYLNLGTLYYNGSYYLKGYIKGKYIDSQRYYILNENNGVAIGIETKSSKGNVLLANFTDENWVNGISIDNNCLLVEYTDENWELIEKSKWVGNGERIMYNINSYDRVENWLRIFISGNNSTQSLAYPNNVYLY